MVCSSNKQLLEIVPETINTSDPTPHPRMPGEDQCQGNNAYSKPLLAHRGRMRDTNLILSFLVAVSKTEWVKLIGRIYHTCQVQMIISILTIKLLMKYFTFFFHTKSPESDECFYGYGTSRLGQATFQMVHRHVWPVEIIVGSVSRF